MTKTLPQAFWDRIENIYSKEDIEIIKSGYNTEKRKTSFRVNTIKATEEQILELLKENNLEVTKVSYLDNCYVLENGTEKDLWELDLFENGKIYIQQIASQIPVQFMDLTENSKILDTTAAPGSKTSQIAALTKNTSEIIAVDNNAIRIDKLNYTIKKQWVKKSLVFKTDARKIHVPLGEYLELQGWSVDDTKEYFDHILFDAPCTAEGRFNLNKEKSFGFWNETIFKKAYKLSKSILEEIIPMLKVDGTLVYSTCTLAPEENEAITHFILSNYPEMELVPVKIDSPYTRAGIKSFGKQIYRSDVVNTVRCLPSEETEGFYIAKFKKVAL